MSVVLWISPCVRERYVFRAIIQHARLMLHWMRDASARRLKWTLASQVQCSWSRRRKAGCRAGESRALPVRWASTRNRKKT
jgi:hypothetical protein